MKTLIIIITLLSVAAKADKDEKIDFNSMISEVETNIEQQALSFQIKSKDSSKFREPAAQSKSLKAETIKAIEISIKNEIQ